MKVLREHDVIFLIVYSEIVNKNYTFDFDTIYNILYEFGLINDSFIIVEEDLLRLWLEYFTQKFSFEFDGYNIILNEETIDYVYKFVQLYDLKVVNDFINCAKICNKNKKNIYTVSKRFFN